MAMWPVNSLVISNLVGANMPIHVILINYYYNYSGAKPKYWSFYGSSSLPIMLANLGCTGSEETLLDCYRKSYAVLDCNKYRLAGVECEGITIPFIVLIH